MKSIAKQSETKGLVLKIHRNARHDGPGIRTLVCMKGCPLRCRWCSTPESIGTAPEVMTFEQHCTGCGKCDAVCPQGAIQRGSINRELCNNCGACVNDCIYGALELMGTHMSVDSLFRELEKDAVGYRRSGGGVTIGGGELTLQADFAAAVLARCRKVFYHTAIETCGYCRWENLEKVLPHVKLLYYDVKHMDDETHKQITGVSNRIILENLAKAVKFCPTIVRIPLVPGLNDSRENIVATARFARDLGENLQRVELLPYHNFGVASYSRLGRKYPLKHVGLHTDEELQMLRRVVEGCGVDVQIGG